MIGLTIAGFDPSGGAGISTDIKTMAAHGVHGCAAVTALTAQNPKKVFSVEPVSTTYISEQIDSIFDEYTIKYSKTGLLYSKEIIQLVSKKVDEYDLSIVVDPVMVASAGDLLAKAEIANSLKKYLLTKAALVTPSFSAMDSLVIGCPSLTILIIASCLFVNFNAIPLFDYLRNIQTIKNVFYLQYNYNIFSFFDYA